MERNHVITINDRYECRKLLGEGTDGRVFLAYDRKLKKEWALKECKELPPGGLMAFRKLNCHIFPRIVDLIQENNRQYLVMDYVEGRSLRERMSEGAVSEGEVRMWAAEIAEGMLLLHKMEPPLLYMDCKPDNIMLTPENEIRIIDFGSMYACEESRQQRISGTLFYASPEQKNYGKQRIQPDVRTDIYAFGMTLYVLLTGKEEEYRNRTGTLLVRALNPAISEGMESVIAKCTALSPHKRYQSMEEVLYHLKHIDRIGKQSNRKALLRKSIDILLEVFSAAGTLICALAFAKGRGEISFAACILCILFFVLLVGKRKQKQIVIWKMKQDIFRGCGKKVLLLMAAVFLFLGKLPVKAYQERESFSPILYDGQGRKILIKQDGVWETDGDIFVQIPKEELSKNINEIVVSCSDTESGSFRKFSFQCLRKESGAVENNPSITYTNQ
ncbi:MAG: serine/threonine-protein kinase [Lachnospiraceae bacterium]|nr:serine/threonine-protein kinase [Lachnospiraceae bacterium]